MDLYEQILSELLSGQREKRAVGIRDLTLTEEEIVEGGCYCLLTAITEVVDGEGDAQEKLEKISEILLEPCIPDPDILLQLDEWEKKLNG